MDLEQRKKLAESLKGRESRRMPVSGLEMRDDGDGTVKLIGCASVVEHRYDMGVYQEVIKRGAFDKTLSESPDVQLLVGHEGLPLARSSSGTLRLSAEDRGLMVDADLDRSDPDVQRLLPKVARGDLTAMSFAFRVVRQSWDDAYENRDILEVNLNGGDVSVVGMPANPAASFSLRSADDYESALAELPEDERAEVRRRWEARLAAELEMLAAPTPPNLELFMARAFALRSRG